MDVQLWVPYDDLTTLYYDLGDPGMYGNTGVGRPWRTPMTRIERTNDAGAHPQSVPSPIRS